MAADPRIEPLDELTRGLESVLALLDEGERTSGDALLTAWQACDRSFEVLRGVNEALADRTTSSDVRERLDRVRRLQAVALGLCSRRKDTIGEGLARVVAVKRALAGRTGATAAPAAGTSCDVAG